MTRWHTLLGLVGGLALQVGCFKVTNPVRTTAHAGTDADTLVLLLPGFGASDRTFEKKEVIATMREAGLKADILAVNANYGYYVGEELIPRLREDVFADVGGRYEHIWVVGISMGGLGTLLTLQAFREHVDGVVLLSPYLGRAKTLDVVSAAPLAAYQAPDAPMWDEDLWRFLTALETAPETLPPIYLGHGTKDLGVARHVWLSGYLPPERVRVVEGGHTWAVWRELIGAFVAEDLLDEPGFAASL